MHVEGGCHCGTITYEADINPENVVICHCTDCQKLSGTAFRTVVFTEDENFDLKSGELINYIKIAESGNERIQAFCPNCVVFYIAFTNTRHRMSSFGASPMTARVSKKICF